MGWFDCNPYDGCNPYITGTVTIATSDINYYLKLQQEREGDHMDYISRLQSGGTHKVCVIEKGMCNKTSYGSFI